MGGAIAIGECFVVQKDFNYWAIFLNYCRVKSTRMSNSIVARPGGEMVVVSKLVSVGSDRELVCVADFGSATQLKLHC